MLAVASMFGTYAQQNSTTDEETYPPYKLKKGNVTTELTLSPFSIYILNDGEGLTTGSLMPGLRLRVGLNGKLALRVNMQLDLGYNTIKKNLDDTFNNGMYKQIIKGNRTTKGNHTQFTFAPGIEYHFGKWERLSIYVGGEIPFGFYVTKSKIEENITIEYFEWGYYENGFEWIGSIETNSTLETKNCAGSYVCDPWGCNYYYHQTGKMFFGINAFTGFDFYIYKGLYIGAELSIGYSHSFALKGTVKGETTRTSQTWYGTETRKDYIDEKFDDKIINGNLSFRCNPIIRLGWRF
jgi:hypothetical protein